MKDFKQLADMINSKHPFDLCARNAGTCYTKKTCDEIDKAPGVLEITLKDETGNNFHLSMDESKMFLDHTQVTLPKGYNCFIPIIGQSMSTKNTWFVGEFMMSKYYTVYDMS